jgi:hypothetical protein
LGEAAKLKFASYMPLRAAIAYEPAVESLAASNMMPAVSLFRSRPKRLMMIGRFGPIEEWSNLTFLSKSQRTIMYGTCDGVVVVVPLQTLQGNERESSGALNSLPIDFLTTQYAHTPKKANGM